MDQEDIKKERNENREATRVEDIASKINPSIKILKNIGLNQNDALTNDDETQETSSQKAAKGIITYKSKDSIFQKKHKKDINNSINYNKLLYSYQVIIFLLVLLIGILIGTFIISPFIYSPSKSKPIKKISFNKRSEIFTPVPVFTSDGKEYIVEHFEGNKNYIRKWWKYGNLKVYNKAISKMDMYNLGKKAIGLYKSDVLNTGVFGTFLGIDGKRYKFIEILVYGFGKNSGSLQINLYDDDNNNFNLETDYADQNILNFDDVFAYNLKINWKGWKKLVIPIKDFKDNNPLIGDDIYNPDQKKRSGGLIVLEFLIKNHLNCFIDSIKLI